MINATYSTLNKTIDMKSLFFFTLLFCAASAKAQLPPVRTSDLSGIQTERGAATAVPLRKTDNVSNTSDASLRTAGISSTASKVPLRSSGPEATNVGIEKLPIRSSGPGVTAVVVEKVPVRSTDPAANAANGAQQKN